MRAYLEHSCGTQAEVTFYKGEIAVGTATIQTHAPAEEIGRMVAAAPDLLAALARIRDARDHNAETGRWPADTVMSDQCFDDWAADVASAAIAKAGGDTIPPPK